MTLTHPWLMHGVVFVLALAAFACLALAMSRHQKDAFGKAFDARKTRIFSLAGWLLLLFDLFAAVWTMGWAFGLAAWSGHTSLAAGVVMVALMMRTEQKKPAAAVPRAGAKTP